MSDSLDDLLGDPNDSRSAGGKLREQLEQALAREKALEARLAAVEQSTRADQVKALASKHGIPDLALDFFPKEGDLTDEAATSFIEKYGALWGAQATTATTAPEQQQAATAAQQFTAQARPPAAEPLSQEAIESKLREVTTRDGLLKALAELEPLAGMHDM